MFPPHRDFNEVSVAIARGRKRRLRTLLEVSQAAKMNGILAAQSMSAFAFRAREAEMKKRVLSRWPIAAPYQALIAIAMAVILTFGLFLLLRQVFLWLPDDGWTELSINAAPLGAFEISVPAFFVILVTAYVTQRRLTADRRAESDEY
jgi:hypothetical protein